MKYIQIKLLGSECYNSFLYYMLKTEFILPSCRLFSFEVLACCKVIKTQSLQLFLPLYPPIIYLDSVLEFVRSHDFHLTRDLSSRSYFLTKDLCFLESTKLNVSSTAELVSTRDKVLQWFIASSVKNNLLIFRLY